MITAASFRSCSLREKVAEGRHDDFEGVINSVGLRVAEPLGTLIRLLETNNNEQRIRA